MDKKQEEVARQIAELRQMTKLTGRLHQAQIEQLRRWPIGVVPTALRTDVDFEITDDSRTIFVNFTMKDDLPTTEQLAFLAENIFWLLGDDWNFVAEVNGTKIYEDAATDSASNDPG